MSRALIHVLGISGSLRRASTNTAVISAASAMTSAEWQVRAFAGLDAIPPFNPDTPDAETPAAVVALRGAIADCDALLISSPEYAHGVPGVLKNALDWLVGSGECIDKPIAVINASSRATHARASLVETLVTMSAHVVERASITLPLDGRGADARAILADADLARALRNAVDALAATARPMNQLFASARTTSPETASASALSSEGVSAPTTNTE